MTWSVFEVVRSRYPGDWSKGLADDLERKSNVLIQLTHLHPLVHTVRVILTRRRSEQVLPAFAACLFRLTSVTKLVVAKAHTAMTTHLKEGFDGYTFRHIREIELPTQAHNVLRCCPEVRIVTANEFTNMESSKLISAIRAVCPRVEEVKDFQLDLKQLKSLSKAAPNLRILGRVTLNRDESENQ
ncbi:hypothetical protein BDZ89DRAFT_52620 [Hymenopellis radicata]|nr:hypothetical protein BDZ89DRAFT_52620 [Hymenopellis radicata]